MGTKTKIEWADSTWSPWRGCTKVSPGCLNCYAETLAKRNPAVLGGWGKGAPRVLAKNWQEPMRWNCRLTCDCGTVRTASGDPRFGACPVCESPQRNQRVFPSLCDWLDDEVPVEWLARFLNLIAETPSVDWLLLTKRPELWASRMRACIASKPACLPAVEWCNGTPPVNVWFGVSVEDQTRADERIPLLLEIPAAMRWLSVEPMLGPVDLLHVETEEGSSLDSLTGDLGVEGRGHTGPKPERVDWVVVGGESGPKARVCHADWIRSLVRQCDGARVPVFVKQVGTRPVDRVLRGAEWGELKDPNGGNPDEWPMELNVPQFPEL